MALKIDWRRLVSYQVRVTQNKLRSVDPYIYESHMEEAFSACVGFIRQHHPDATLNFNGSDLGGYLYEVREEKQ